MTSALDEIIEEAKKVRMSDAQLKEQRLSFVYGNTHFDNPRITPKVVAEAEEKVAQEEALAALESGACQ